MSRAPYAQRLNRDVSELFSHNFDCSASSLKVLQTSDSLQASGSLLLQISIYDGPYRGGCFNFGLSIPENYPFRPVEVFATQPIWHPNIDLFTGKVALPMEWSPVLTLNSLALAVQMLLLEPSAENPLNMDAYSSYISQSDTFEQLVQKSIQGGCIISGIKFSSVQMASHSNSLGESINRFTNKNNTSNNSIIEDGQYMESASPQSAMAVSSNGNSPISMSTNGGSALANSNLEINRPGGTPYHFQQLPTVKANIAHNTTSNDNTSSKNDDKCKIDADGAMDGSAIEDITRFTSVGCDAESAVRSKKRGFEHTESSMELETLCRQEAAQVSRNIPGLVRLTSVDEWNQRIAMAYSQLSLGAASNTSSSTTAASEVSPGSYIGNFGAADSNPRSQHLNAIDFVPQRQCQMQMRNTSVCSELDKLSMGLGHGNTSERSLSSMGMEICSPNKRVKFYLSDT